MQADVNRYEERFQTDADVERYESAEYGRESYPSFIWELQKPILRRLIARQERTPQIRLLDFACGTGRILSFVEKLVDQADGVDISPSMLQRATGRCTKSRLYAGDIVADRDLANHRYDIVTAFRFLLNADISVRKAALQALRGRIDEEHGVLIANVHGNAFSLRHLPILYRKWRLRRSSSAADQEVMIAEMGLAEIDHLFRDCGFHIAEQFGFGITPQFVHRTPARAVARWIDRHLAAREIAKNVSIDLLFVCRPLPL